jgi:CheY-like chemotaxis protein
MLDSKAWLGSAMLDLKRWFSFANFKGRPLVREADSGDGSRASVRLLAILPRTEDAEQLRRIGGDLGWSVSIVNTTAEAMDWLQTESVTAAICDQDLGEEDWRVVMYRIATLPRSPCVLLASRVMDQYLWNEVILNRGYDVVSKPFQSDELRRVVAFALSFPGQSQQRRTF